MLVSVLPTELRNKAALLLLSESEVRCRLERHDIVHCYFCNLTFIIIISRF